MSIFTDIGHLLKEILPFLKSAAEKAVDKLPEDQKNEAIAISKMVEVIKQNVGKPFGEVVSAIEKQAGIDQVTVEKYLIDYLKQKGKTATGLQDALEQIYADASQRTVTGLNALWSGMSNTISAVWANLDWQTLLMGVGEFLYREFVKGKI